MRTVRTLFILLSVISVMGVNAQNYVTPVRSDITPPSPQSAAIVAVQTPEPDLLTGAVNIYIPIYTLQVNNYSLPISLKYHSNGIKVFDDPTPLGYGWSLMPALRATRTVYGRPDDLYPFVPQDPQTYEMPMGMAFMCLVRDGVQSNIYKHLYDSEHDVFTFALPDKTITRVLDLSSGNPVFKGADDAEYHVEANSDLSSITVTDPYANRYVFGGTYEFYNQDDGKMVRTAWALSTIYLDNGDQIDFSWSNKQHGVVNKSWLGGFSFMDFHNITDWVGATFDPINFESDNATNATFSRINDCTSFLQLNTISFKGIQIAFSYLSSNTIPAMTQIQVQAEGQVIRTFSFTYENTNYTLLKKVDAGGGQQYSFEYNTAYGTIPLSNWNTVCSQDWWGYFNNKTNIHNSLTPKLRIKKYSNYLDTQGSYDMVGDADRSVDVNAMQAMILKKITWPTGGTTSFTYEAHKFSPTKVGNNGEIHPEDDPELSEGGGLRVASVTTTTGTSDPNPLTVNYQYSLATVRAVPSAATFVEVYEALLPRPNRELLHPKLTTSLRQVNVMPISDYMKYDDGATPLWYPTVTAVYPEGKVVVTHEDRLATLGVKPAVSYGKRVPNDKVYIFGVSPVMSSRKIYDSAGAVVESTEYIYTARSSAAIVNYHISRNKLYLDESDASPDVPDGCYPDSPNTNMIIDDAYSIRTYSIVPYSLTLTQTTTTEHAENGNFARTQTFGYKTGTGLLSEVSESTSDGSVSRTQLYYPEAGGGDVASKMVTANCIGVPVREIITRGSTTVEAQAEYTDFRYATRCFRKKQVRLIYKNPADTLFGPVCSYSSYGFLTRTTDADGLMTDWTWDEYNPTSRKSGGLISLFDHKLLVGLSQLTTPWGSKTKYTYDGIGRLESVTIDGLGKIGSYSYGLGNQSNYIESTTYLSAVSSNTTTELYDNLGRIYATMNSATGLMQQFGYDNMGRGIRTSVPSTESPGMYDYNLTAYETSPRGKAISTTKAGSQWHNGGKSVTVRTLVNTASGTYACPRYSISSAGLITHHGNYAASSLIINEVTDENGHITRTYTDKSGLEVMSEEGKGSDMLRTRRVYDDYGRLRAILTPAVSDGNISATDREFLMNCYEFGYDGTGRLTSSRSPGMTKAIQTRYSRGGRVVAERTAAMAGGKWLVHFYDAAGRRVVTDEASLSETQLRTLQKTFSIASYTSATSIAGYTLTPAAPFTIATPLYASYYDTYDFRSKCADSQMPAVTGTRKGLQTGAYDGSGLRDGGAKGYFAVMQYDDWGRVIRTDRQCDRGVLTDISTYDRQGNVLTYSHKLTGTDGTVLTLSGTNIFDGAGRVKKWTTQMGTASAGADITYGTLGMVSKEKYVNQAERQYLYDCHGWLTEIRNIPYMFVTVPGLTSAFYAEATGIAEPQISYDYPGSYTEKILYADGTTPRYDGTASAHVSSLGGRYDYTYDNHDRLTAAAYSSSTRGENYSTEYSYNALGAPTSLKRKGRNTEFFGSIGGYGVVDDLTYSWDGAQLQTVTATASGSDYYGRTGFPLSATGGTADFWFDDAGQMTMDSSRGIIDLNYNRQGLPVQVTFSDGSRVIYTYSYAGELRSMKSYYKTLLTSRREYCGDFIFENDTISMVNFPGGYFDSKGNPFYRHTDWQGNVTMVTNSSGKIAQHTGCYPYGEPWSEPSGQPYLYGGKERLREGGLNEYDFGARRYNSALALWTTPDPLASTFANTNPYSYCAGNPIRYVDQTGKWYAEVHASSDRQKNPYAVFTAYTNDGIKVFETIVRVKGQHRQRDKSRGDTPTGTYKILEWRKTGKDGDIVNGKPRYNEKSFGPNDLLALNYVDGEAKAAGRNYMHCHGGGRQDGEELSNTEGCIRFNDDDIALLKDVTDALLALDPTDTPTNIVVTNDLENSIQMSDRKSKNEENERQLLIFNIMLNINQYLIE